MRSVIPKWARAGPTILVSTFDLLEKDVVRPVGVSDVVNEHGQTNAWREIRFDGRNVLANNTLRRFLAKKPLSV